MAFLKALFIGQCVQKGKLLTLKLHCDMHQINVMRWMSPIRKPLKGPALNNPSPNIVLNKRVRLVRRKKKKKIEKLGTALRLFHLYIWFFGTCTLLLSYQ